MTINKIDKYLLLFSSFIEGGALMAVEILSSKIISPYYGTSLYVWAAILGITMGGLALGYFLGGHLSLSEKKSQLKILLLIFAISSFFVWLIPHSAFWIMKNTLIFEIRVGIIVSCIFFLLPPIVSFGLVTPMTIRLLAKNKTTIGFTSGLVYTISTIGGIMATFLTGFFLISKIGVIATVNSISISLMIPPVMFGLISVFKYLKKIPQINPTNNIAD